MSLILFFGLAALITLVGLVFSGLVIRHHWQQSRLQRKTETDSKTLANQISSH